MAIRDTGENAVTAQALEELQAILSKPYKDVCNVCKGVGKTPTFITCPKCKGQGYRYVKLI